MVDKKHHENETPSLNLFPTIDIMLLGVLLCIFKKSTESQNPKLSKEEA